MKLMLKTDPISRWSVAICLALSGPLVTARGGEVEGLNDSLRLDQVQYIGTHNSYHIAPGDAIGILMLGSGFSLSEEWTAQRLVEATDFTHPAITAQLQQGMRLFELDVHDDPNGGRFEQPGFLRMLEKTPWHLPFGVGRMDDLKSPGFKVFHQPDWDFRSTNYLLSGCLEEIESWSSAHPGHLPIIIQIEVKDSEMPLAVVGRSPVVDLPITADTWRRLEEAIKAVIPPDKLFTPDQLRGDHRNLKEAIEVNGWPTLAELKGKIVFLLLNKKELSESYLKLDPLLRGRLFFASLTPDHASASWFRVPDPNYEGLPGIIARGYLVSTMADQHTVQSRQNDVTNREKSFRSGAQFISTDYPQPDRRFSDYHVSFEDGAFVRPNPARDGK